MLTDVHDRAKGGARLTVQIRGASGAIAPANHSIKRRGTGIGLAVSHQSVSCASDASLQPSGSGA